MQSRIIVGAATALALGLAGMGVGDSAAQQPDRPNKAPTEQPAQQPAPTTEGQHAPAQPAQAAAKPTPITTLDAVSLASLNENDIKSLQGELKSLGYYKAAVDGIMGPQTRGAMTRFFQDQVRLLAQGKISEATLASLGWSQNEIQRVRGMDEGSEKAAPEKAVPEKAAP